MKIIHIVKVLVLSKTHVMSLSILPLWVTVSWGKLVVVGQLINRINQLLATHDHYGNEILSPLEFDWSPLHALVVNPCSISKNYVTVCTYSNLSDYEFVSTKLSTSNFVSYRSWTYSYLPPFVNMHDNGKCCFNLGAYYINKIVKNK